MWMCVRRGLWPCCVVVVEFVIDGGYVVRWSGDSAMMKTPEIFKQQLRNEWLYCIELRFRRRRLPSIHRLAYSKHVQ